MIVKMMIAQNLKKLNVGLENLDVHFKWKTVSHFQEITFDWFLAFFPKILFSYSAKLTKGGCIEKSTYDEINAEESKCKGLSNNKDETTCVCNNDLCNDGKEDKGSGVENIIPQFGMILLLSFSVFYFTS